MYYVIGPASAGLNPAEAPTSDLGARVPAGADGPLPVPSAPGRYLLIESGAPAALIPLAADVVHVGRGFRCQVRLDDQCVSRRHALLVRRPGSHRVLDDRSSNGTFVNGVRVNEADLADGDVLRVGEVVMRYLEVT
jgi:pSer/pThr/pTyr-binding forkhead associated (FHA) protein